ncbi:MAG: hypothetical protein QOH25_2667 [Acidobacteriota bacterium]|jgi:hypothetical protein|nr:hypothetical protein [Acidobacteriota bacterium]
MLIPSEYFDAAFWEREITDAVETLDPALSNRKITLVHYRLSQVLQAVIGTEAGANFHTWAVWGSRKAGVTIRQEDLGEAIHNATVVSGIVGFLVGLAASWISKGLWLTNLHWSIILLSALFGMFCGSAVGRQIAIYSRREAARLILTGNRIVLADIGKQTARFVELFHDKEEEDADSLKAFLAELRGGETASGGQDLLRQAFTQYYIARYAKDLKQKHEAAYFANCLAVYHEHIRLEPYIKKSMPFIIRKCATKRLMQFDVGTVCLKVSAEVPALDGVPFPETLHHLSNQELSDFLNGENEWRSGFASGPARDWTNINERMRYIFRLFRAMHLEQSVFDQPDTA